MSSFADFRLIAPLNAAVKQAGYSVPTPIQEKSIPYLLQGRDLLGIAQTGTGKTAAFALPMLQFIATNRRPVARNHARTLILTPTRELAAQIGDSFQTYGRGLRFRSSVIFGGVGQGRQVSDLSAGLDVLVATPGRLLDLMNQGYVRLEGLEIFVLDEADRMLDMGFIHDVRRVISHLPKERQTLLFSATMPSDIADLACTILRDPVRVEATPPATTVETVTQKVLFVNRADKIGLLAEILREPEVTLALVFTRTKHGADKVVHHLHRMHISADAIHGNKSQNNRERALRRFRDGEIKALIATDIAARGIDVPGVSHVINFDLPNEPEAYVHRIGRTARAGRSGVALSLCDAEEKMYLRDIERLIGFKVGVDSDHPFHSDSAATAPPVKPPTRQRGARSPLPREERNDDGRRQNRRDSRFRSNQRPTRHSEGRGRPRQDNLEPRGLESRAAAEGDAPRSRPFPSPRPKRRRF